MNRNYFKWAGFIPREIVIACATFGPLGRRMKAPGTVGSAVGLAWYAILFSNLTPLGYLFTLAITVYVAMAICDAAELHMKVHDPQCVILDEVVAVPVCFIGLQGAMQVYPPWMLGLGAFILFRAFDILKPFGIQYLEKLPGGIGVVADDLAAGLATCTCLHLMLYSFPLKIAL